MLARNTKDIASYRQPMITSLGIIMGFLLNFLANWATKEDTVSEFRNIADVIVGVTMVPALVLMLIVLYRMLDMRHPEDDVENVYMRTLRLYMAAIILAFCGVAVALFF